MSINPQLYPSVPPVQDSASRPFWTVLIPAYKPQNLAQALRSVLDQDPGPEQMQILVIDDCSPSALEPIVRQSGGNRVTYIRQEKNLGTYGTQNHGLLMSRGLWIHVLNDDDWVLPGFYGAFRTALQNQPASVGAACCLYTNTDSQGCPIFMPDLLRITPGILENWIMTMGVKNPLHPVAVVVRRSVHERLGGYCPGLKYTADWEFYKRAAIHYDWWYEPRVMACYREHSQNCSHDAVISGDQIRELGRAIEMTEPHLPPELRAKITAAARDFYAAYAINRAEVMFRTGDVPAAVRQLQAGLQLSSSPQILDGLVVLLGRPGALPLRQLLPQFIQMVR